ncbi:MAG: universal stress protein [Alphaproteobacteria bacterium]|nr:universal stress protein [Alphaproteobacteria bacterium]
MTDAPRPRRRKFLVVVDETPECKVALRFAARRAAATNGLVTLLHVISPADPQQWMAVAQIMRDEAFRDAEAILHQAAKEVNELTGVVPELEIREGRKKDQVLELLKQDPDISVLILGAGTGSEGPGPLVELAAKGVGNAYPIPVTIVPGSLSNETVDALA